jgi:conjugative transfer region protein TrbK
MERTAKIVLVAVRVALILTLAIIGARLPSASGSSADGISREDLPSRAEPVPARCRIAVEPDAECAAAWQAKRRRFFGQEDESNE